MNNIIFLRLESKYLAYGFVSNFTCLCWPDYYCCPNGSIRCTGSLTANNQFLPFFSQWADYTSLLFHPVLERQPEWVINSVEIRLENIHLRTLVWGLPTRLCFRPSAEKSQVHLGGRGDEMLVFSRPVYVKRMLLFCSSLQSSLG